MTGYQFVCKKENTNGPGSETPETAASGSEMDTGMSETITSYLSLEMES